jgi:hypothetical protein
MSHQVIYVANLMKSEKTPGIVPDPDLVLFVPMDVDAALDMCSMKTLRSEYC